MVDGLLRPAKPTVVSPALFCPCGSGSALWLTVNPGPFESSISSFPYYCKFSVTEIVCCTPPVVAATVKTGAAAAVVVATVKVVVVAPPCGVTCAGEKLQVTPGVSPEQAKEGSSLKGVGGFLGNLDSGSKRGMDPNALSVSPPG
jgi:hypothetical protein